MQEYEDLRKQKQEEYAAQRRRRIELRNSKNPMLAVFYDLFILKICIF